MDALSLDGRPANFSDPAIKSLIAAHIAASRLHCKPDDWHAETVGALDVPGIIMLAAYIGGEAIAVGGMRDVGGGVAEVKSVFTGSAARGYGAGQTIVEALIEAATAAAFRCA